jgi:uncharacterized protein YjbJ (UPF0337 family)
MSTMDKAKNVADEATASVKEAAGKLTGNESLENEGATEKSKADLKQSGEKLKDGLHDVTE